VGVGVEVWVGVEVGVEVAEGVEVGLGIEVGVEVGVAVEVAVGGSTWATSTTTVTAGGGSLDGEVIATAADSTVWLRLQADKIERTIMLKSQFGAAFRDAWRPK
jgi:hypothetical protein